MTPTSKSQIRAAKLAGITVNDSYADAKKALEAAGLEGDGIPAGYTWRTAAKLSDADLLAKLAKSEPERYYSNYEIYEGVD